MTVALVHMLASYEGANRENKQSKMNAYFFPNRPFFLPAALTSAVVVAATLAPDQSNLVLANLCPRVFLFLAQAWLRSVPRLV